MEKSLFNVFLVQNNKPEKYGELLVFKLIREDTMPIFEGEYEFCKLYKK